ncbi:MAG TPA: pyridoxamine 5'-phosphate oxidase family protein [Leptolyngbyaceae cyanobacterium M65_K2018_010]|nr:pyridoxamine 5'-phosphate oxidase family protein [Leptolyngbyaceae cyanobacterium M65_K2018_010]
MIPFEKVETAYQALPNRVKSLMLSTVNADGTPLASYAPFIRDPDYRLYILTSGLSAHTENLGRTGQASVLMIEDEAEAPQVFARQRLAYDCQVTVVARQSPAWEALADQFEQRFGEIIQMLRQLEDFQMFCLSPLAGRFVMGFGAAYEVDGEDLGRLQQGAVRG